MLKRFCLYGFVKNQRYFEPFLILALRENGLSFSTIGMLIGFREICRNVLEVPTGAIADSLGRRRAMIAGHLAYIAAFICFGLLKSTPVMFLAMGMFALGEAFRTGTHKAIIFSWLAHEGRKDDKVAIYGYTRSWSKLGSAAAVIIAAALVITTDSYASVFLLSTIPCIINIINFITYPGYTDGEIKPGFRPADVLHTLISSFHTAFSKQHLRRILAGSMVFSGMFHASKDYIQPAILAAALSIAIMSDLNDHTRVAVLTAGVYALLHLLESIAARRSYAVAKLAGSWQAAAKWLWGLNLLTMCLLAAGVLAGLDAVVIGSFVLAAAIHNLWKPLAVARIAEACPADQTATVLSVDSQGRALLVAVLAPAIGFAVDCMPQKLYLLPIAISGIILCALASGTERNAGRGDPQGANRN